MAAISTFVYRETAQEVRKYKTKEYFQLKLSCETAEGGRIGGAGLGPTKGTCSGSCWSGQKINVPLLCNLYQLPAASVLPQIALRSTLGQVILPAFPSSFLSPACGCTKTTRRSKPSFPAPSQPLPNNLFVILLITEVTFSENNADPFPGMKTSSNAGLGWGCAGYSTPLCSASPH